jgi:hypothetical protein
MRAHALTDRDLRRRGHTLLEMVLAVTTLATVLGGVLQITTGSRAAWRLSGSKSHLQESGRRMLESILAELRHSGLTSVAGSNYPAIYERPRGTAATPRGNLVATMSYADEALVSEVFAKQGDGDRIRRNAARVSNEILFQLPQDLDRNGTPLDANGELEWGPELFSYRVVDDPEGRPWLERRTERPGTAMQTRLVGPSVRSITFDVVFNDRTLRYGVVDVVLWLEEIDAAGQKITAAVEGSVALRNTRGL